ncbi:MAG: 2-amino-4-hydroxy-6-hydroxymethyldihydropteridine diphosphokinase [Gammaproteobacteria bacterium]
MLDKTRADINVYLSLGSNIEPEANLRMACRELMGDYGELEKSSVYRNEAVGFEGDDFLNMVVGFQTEEQPEAIVERLEQIHEQAGREREPGNPFCARTLDLDLLLYGDMVRRRAKLPHGDIEKYGFVLKPLAEVAPELKHPVSGKAMIDMWDNFDHERHPLERIELEID